MDKSGPNSNVDKGRWQAIEHPGPEFYYIGDKTVYQLKPNHNAIKSLITDDTGTPDDSPGYPHDTEDGYIDMTKDQPDWDNYPDLPVMSCDRRAQPYRLSRHPKIRIPYPIPKKEKKPELEAETWMAGQFPLDIDWEEQVYKQQSEIFYDDLTDHVRWDAYPIYSREERVEFEGTKFLPHPNDYIDETVPIPGKYPRFKDESNIDRKKRIIDIYTEEKEKKVFLDFMVEVPRNPRKMGIPVVNKYKDWDVDDDEEGAIPWYEDQTQITGYGGGYGGRGGGRGGGGGGFGRGVGRGWGDEEEGVTGDWDGGGRGFEGGQGRGGFRGGRGSGGGFRGGRDGSGNEKWNRKPEQFDDANE